MSDIFSRTKLILGDDAMNKLCSARVAVFGLGGVGGYVVEALSRSGVGAIDLIDSDRVDSSNINRQILATHSTLGRLKVDVAAERIADINPACKITTHNVFFLPSTEDEFDFRLYDYVVDAIDTVAGKLALVKKAKWAGVPIISAMGAGNKLNPSFEVADIYKTSVCPLAKVMRRELRKLGIDSLKVVYSKEKPIRNERLSQIEEGTVMLDKQNDTCDEQDYSQSEHSSKEQLCKSNEEYYGTGGRHHEEDGTHRRRAVPGSIAFVPPVMGLVIASEVIKDLIGKTR